jgi:hypothetical protein
MQYKKKEETIFLVYYTSQMCVDMNMTIKWNANTQT